MVLSIKDPDADRLARRLATLTGESLTDAVKADLFPSLVAGAQINGNYVGMPAWANRNTASSSARPGRDRPRPR